MGDAGAVDHDPGPAAPADSPAALPAWATQPPPTHQPWDHRPPSAQPDGAHTYGVPFWTPPPPSHPRATTSLVLGVVAVAASVVAGFTLLLGPLAWYLGARAMRDIDREPGRWTGRGQAKAGLVLGIVATVLLVIVVFFVLLFALLAVIISTYDSGYPTT